MKMTQIAAEVVVLVSKLQLILVFQWIKVEEAPWILEKEGHAKILWKIEKRMTFKDKLECFIWVVNGMEVEIVQRVDVVVLKVPARKYNGEIRNKQLTKKLEEEMN